MTIFSPFSRARSGPALSIAEYKDPNTCRRPTKSEVTAATDFKIDNWLRFDFVADDLKSRLAAGDPIVIGFMVDKGFDQLRGSQVYAGQQGMTYPHALTVVGYDDYKQAFKVINSWGIEWGQKGFGWISYDAFQRDAREAYVMEVRPRPVPRPEPEIATPAPPPAPRPVPRVKPIQPKPSPKIAEPIPQPDAPMRAVSASTWSAALINGSR
jgi:hypothetical protein